MPGADVVHRRVGVLRAELRLVLAQAVVAGPLPGVRARRVIAQHVEHADRRQRSAEQIRPLRQHCADQQPAVAAAADRELRRRRVLLRRSAIRAAAMKSSNTFCFCSFVPALCHASPYSEPPRRLATAKAPPISSQTQHGHAECRLLRDVEAAVAVQHHRRLAVLDEVALACVMNIGTRVPSLLR